MIEIGLVEYTPKEFVLEIKDKFNNVKAKYAINDKDKHVEKLMDEHFVEISFELDSFVGFVRSDYILYNGRKYILRKNVTPDKLNTYRYRYELMFEAEEMLLKDASFYYLRQELKEASFNLTTDADSFMQIVVDNANRYFGEEKFKIGVVQPTGIKHIFFDQIKTFDALIEISKTFNAEFLFDKDYNIHLLNKANISNEVELETDISIEKLEHSETTPNIPYNRIIPLGSIRNLPANYRAVETGEAVDAIYQKRLRIPLNKGQYIDAKENMSPEEVVEGVVVFDNVYPHRVGTISDITTKEYTDTDESTGAKTKWNAYRYKDKDLQFKSEYLLDGVELRIVFQSGNLNGMDFAIKFNPDNHKEDDSKAQVFEIIRNEDYSISLPNNKLHPNEGDAYILYGFDIKLVNDKYIPEAEEELYSEAIKWIKENYKDTKVYECPTIINYFYKHKLNLDLGQRIKLVDNSLENGSRSSRIIGFEKKLINIYDAIYTVGDNIRYSNLSSLKEEVKNLKADQYYIAHEASNKTPVITQYDSTKPTDRNVLSSLRSLNTFLRKDQDDSTEHLLQLLQGAEFGEFINSLSHGKGAAIDAQGKAQVESLEVRSYLKVMELIYNRLSAVDGDVVFTDSGVVESVQEIEEDTYILTLRKRWEKDFTTFQEGDVLRGVVNNLLTTGEYHTSWMRVITVNNVQNSITVISYPDSEVPVGKNYLPTETMVLHRWGNTINKDRQQTFYTSSTEGRSVYLVDVTQPILKDYNYSSFWGKPIRLKAFEDQPINYNQPYFYARGMLVQDLIRVDYQGQVIKEIIDAGPWQQGKEYKNGEEHPYQQHDVWLGGNRWRCLINNTSEKPRWNSPSWIPIGGNQLLSMKLANTHGTLFRPGQVYTFFIASVYYGDIDITADIEPMDWQWLRETSNPNADLAWIEAHKEATNEIEITDKDIDPNYRYQTRFICKAYVRLRDEITELRKDIIV